MIVLFLKKLNNTKLPNSLQKKIISSHNGKTKNVKGLENIIPITLPNISFPDLLVGIYF